MRHTLSENKGVSAYYANKIDITSEWTMPNYVK